jgi:hypothetical protein
MGVVYKARQVGLKRLVALKMILAGPHAHADELARFRTEAEAVARLQHPHIVQIYEIGQADGLPFFSLEFCAGGSLDQRLKERRPLPHEAAALVEQLARAVQAAHDKGVIHRDLKPANVLLTEDGTLKVTDFGLARKLDEAGQTGTGAVLGTPSYMAPEQASGKNQAVGPATDVWALGAILYELLTGRPPIQAATAMETLLQVLREEPVSPRRLQPKVPHDLETICLKCLRKAPAHRYATAAALAEDLRCFQAGEPIQAQRPPWWRSRRVRRAGVVLAALAAACLLGWAAVKWGMNLRGPQSEATPLTLDEAQAKVATAQQRQAQARRAEEEYRDKVTQQKTAIDSSRRQANLVRQRLQAILQAHAVGGRPLREVQEARFQVYQAEDAEADACHRLEELESAAPKSAVLKAEADLALALLQLAEARRAVGQPAADIATLRRVAAERTLAEALARQDDALRRIEQHPNRTKRVTRVVESLRRRGQEVEDYQKVIERQVKAKGAAKLELLQAEARVLEIRRLLETQVKLLEACEREDPQVALRQTTAEVEMARERLKALASRPKGD